MLVPRPVLMALTHFRGWPVEPTPLVVRYFRGVIPAITKSGGLMTAATPHEQSYTLGTSDAPLLGDTIGDNLARTIAAVR